MTADQAGVAALGALSDILHHLLAADTGLHQDGYRDGEQANHRHPALDWETRTQMEGVKDRIDGLLLGLSEPRFGGNPHADHPLPEVA